MRTVVDLADVSDRDRPLVGGKASKLGELVREGLPIPPGFVITTEAYVAFTSIPSLAKVIRESLAQIDPAKPETAEAASRRIRAEFDSTEFPASLRRELVQVYEAFAKDHSVRFSAVRSSATAEDLEGASFAGLQDTYLNVAGTESVLRMVRRCWSSVFTPRVIAYRERKGFEHSEVALAVLVQKMVDSTVSGILFTRDPNTGENRMIIEAGWGLGEAIVGGEVTPDHYVIDGSTQEIIQKQISEQRIRVVRAEGGGNERQDVPEVERRAQKLSDDRIRNLASLGRRIEAHYRQPMDVEWCADSRGLYIVQARPVTTIPSRGDSAPSSTSRASPAGMSSAHAPAKPGPGSEEEPILRGFGASPGQASGVARILAGASDMEKLRPGEILVTSMTTPDMVPAMAHAAAIVTDEGGMTCHAAIVSRELGVPCVVGTRSATKTIADGNEVTVDGKTGSIYRGRRLTVAAPIPAGGIEGTVGYSGGAHSTPVTATKIYVNVGVPEKATEYAQLPVSGVGLLRTEFIFTAHVREHPLKLLQEGRRDELVRRLAEGIAQVCQAFHPRPVIIRTSDFKTNEYRGMPGGSSFEPAEENPMIGWRGCSRYIAPAFRPAFLAELEAIHQIRTERGLKNAHVMLPFVRNTWELEEITGMMREAGLRRSRDFQLYLMAEVPSTVLLARDFSKFCDGFSIGSNDLTQLVLGADRDSETLGRMGYFDERDPAVQRAIELLIEGAHAEHRTVGICGQGPSVYPEFAEFLVRQGIDSISLNADTVIPTIRTIASLEQRMKLEGFRRSSA